MEPERLEAWLQSRTPTPPAALFSHLVKERGEPFDGPGALEFAGVERILRALALPGRHRVAAFDLLAGDALLTYACEAISEEEDPRAGLEILLKRLGDRLR